MLIIGQFSDSDIGKHWETSGVSSSSDQNRCALPCFYVCMFCPSVSVGRLVTVALLNVLCPGGVENDLFR